MGTDFGTAVTAFFDAYWVHVASFAAGVAVVGYPLWFKGRIAKRAEMIRNCKELAKLRVLYQQRLSDVLATATDIQHRIWEARAATDRTHAARLWEEVVTLARAQSEQTAATVALKASINAEIAHSRALYRLSEAEATLASQIEKWHHTQALDDVREMFDQHSGAPPEALKPQRLIEGVDGFLGLYIDALSTKA